MRSYLYVYVAAVNGPDRPSVSTQCISLRATSEEHALTLGKRKFKVPHVLNADPVKSEKEWVVLLPLVR